MKQFIKHILVKAVILLVFFSILQSCTSDDGTVSCVPKTTVNVVININAYSQLNSAGGWIYLNSVMAGSRGIILVNNGSGFIAYDRNAPHLCPGENTTLVVESDLYILCPADNAKWILLNNIAVNGTKADRPIRTYQVFNNGKGLLTITN